MAMYNFLQSLNRIDSLIGHDAESEVLPYIPLLAEASNEKMSQVCATIMCIKIMLNEDVLPKDKCKFLQAFLSEATRICRANECCRDIVITPDCIIVVYSTPQKVDVDSVIDDSARINSLVMVVNKKSSEKSNYMVSIGIDYGHVMMMPVVGSNDSTIFTWYGRPILEAKKLSECGKPEYISISKIIWNNIRTENQRLFKQTSIMEDYYSGSIINVTMNNWVKTAE